MDARSKQQKLKDLRAQLDALGYGDSQRRATRYTEEALRAVRKRKGGTRESSSSATSRPASSIVYRRDLPRSGSLKRRAPAPGRLVDLEEAVQGHEAVHSAGGSVYVVHTHVPEIEGAAHISSEFRKCIHDPQSGMCKRIERTCPPDDLDVGDILFMDIETTGLGCSPLFLIGVMLWHDGGFEVQQYLARTYAEERAAIGMFLDACRPRPLLVTFNGKSFDLPFIRTRAAATGIPYDIEPDHFDLLHESRRIWKTALPDCKLQTLEKYICGRTRHGDIPGSQIPDAYHDFVRTRDARQVVQILEHNMLDLVTLADIMIRMLPPEM